MQSTKRSTTTLALTYVYSGPGVINCTCCSSPRWQAPDFVGQGPKCEVPTGMAIHG
jgi:hypothetical protein